MAASACLNSVFLFQGQLAKIQNRILTTLQSPYENSVIREAIISPDLQQVALIAELGQASQPQPKILFYECAMNKWHTGYVAPLKTRLSKLTWHANSYQLAFLQQEIRQTRSQGQDAHIFEESLLSLKWPSFEIRNHLKLRSRLYRGRGELIDFTTRHIRLIANFQFHPSQASMLIETSMQEHAQMRAFRMLDLAKTKPEYPVDTPIWFEFLGNERTRLFLTESGALRVRKTSEGIAYEYGQWGSDQFHPLENINLFLKGKGVETFLLRENHLYIRVKTTTRTHLYRLSLPEDVPQSEGRMLASQSPLETLWVYEGLDYEVGDFDFYLNRLIYACRSKTSDLGKVCVGSLSTQPTSAVTVYVADDKASIYPVLTYWPR